MMNKMHNIVKVKRCFWCNSNNLVIIAKRKDGVGVQECQKCHLLQVAEKPRDLSEYYDQEGYFNPDGETETGYHENYDLISPLYLYWQGAVVEEVCRYGNKKNLLEIGCATGNALEIFKSFRPQLSVQGIDISSYAIDICKSKGLIATQSKINEFKSDSKFDIIFSSETMEHVDDLSEFIKGVKNNLKDDGAFVFYIPAVEKDELVEKGDKYPPLRTSLEHLSYFTEEFLNTSLPEALDASIYTKFMANSGEAYHLGIVSKNDSLISNFKNFADSFDRYIKSSNYQTLYDLVVITSKSANFNIAEKYLKDFELLAVSESQTDFLKGVLCYHKGELVKSREYFQRSLGKTPVSNLILKILLSIEKEFNKFLESDNVALRGIEQQVEDYRSQAVDLSNELDQIKMSRVTSPALKIRDILLKLRKKSNQARGLIVAGIKTRTPDRIKNAARSIVRKDVKKIKYIENKPWPNNLPLVTIVTPYFNQGQTINETIQSVLSQTYTNFEYIIVNDGSSARDSKILSSIETNSKVKILHHKINIGKGSPAAARNSGIEIANGKYIICLDSDDKLDPSYIEKCVIVLENNPSISLVTTDIQSFGFKDDLMRYCEYDPRKLLSNNLVSTAAMFTKESWSKVGGYKTGIGYEDWEFWINLAENGYYGQLIPEALFQYRVTISSRYTKDKIKHYDNIRNIKYLHPNFDKIVKAGWRNHNKNQILVVPKTSYINLDKTSEYKEFSNNKNSNILVLTNWMTFGGAETLTINFCREIKNKYNLHFITGLPSNNEWEYKFKEISPFIYHMPNLITNKSLYLEFVSNYIKTRNIDVLHIIHTDIAFDMLPEIKKRHPKLKIIVTMFNDRVESYFNPSINLRKYIDIYTTDNLLTAKHYSHELPASKPVITIPNGVDCYDIFNPDLFDRGAERLKLGISEDDIAIFFIGRLSEEKNPDVYLSAAQRVLESGNNPKVKFFVVGDGGMRLDVEKQIAAIGSGSIFYLGYQSDIPRLLSAADIFVLPSSIEGFPLSILEAMAMNVAVVASDVGAVSDVIVNRRDGFVVRPGSVDDITKIIIKLANNKKLLDKIKTTAQTKLRKKYSNVILGENYSNLYKDILK